MFLNHIVHYLLLHYIRKKGIRDKQNKRNPQSYSSEKTTENILVDILQNIFPMMKFTYKKD